MWGWWHSILQFLISLFSLSHHRYCIIALSLSYYRVIVIAVSLHRAIIPSSSRYRTIASSSSRHRHRIFALSTPTSLVRWCDSELRGPIRIPDKTKQIKQKFLLPGTWTIFTCCKAECVSKYK